MAKLNFQHQLLQSSVSHDPLEIMIQICWFGAEETLLFMLKHLCCLIFLWNHDTFFLDSLMNRKVKRTAFIFIIIIIKKKL